MQGGQGGDVTPKWSNDIPALLANHDILALQEAGPVPPQNQNGPFVYQDSTTSNGYTVYHYLRNFGTSSRPVLRHVYFMNTDPNGNRVNLAMVSAALPDRVWITPPAVFSNGTQPGRPSFGLQFGNTIFNDIHALSGGGDAPGLGHARPAPERGQQPAPDRAGQALHRQRPEARDRACHSSGVTCALGGACMERGCGTSARLRSPEDRRRPAGRHNMSCMAASPERPGGPDGLGICSRRSGLIPGACSPCCKSNDSQTPHPDGLRS
jgi:hypothetical protein